MMNKLQLLTGASLVLALGFTTACGDDSSSNDDTTGGATDAATSDSSGPGATTMPATTDADSGATDAATTDAATTDAATTDPATTAECTMEGELGAACADAECDCMSGNCFVVGPLGGVCSECDEDADCAETTGFGCNFGNPLTGVPAVCSMTGEIGESCESTDACAKGLECGTLISVPGILEASTCGECTDDSACDGQECAPTYDITNIGGFFSCVDAMTVENDQGCDLMGMGEECVSQNCAPAAIMGIPVLGVCSPCNEDSDCAMGETCQLPEIGIDGTALALIPGACV